MNRNQLYNQLTMLCLGLTVALVAIYLLIFLIRPFKPSTTPSVIVQEPTTAPTPTLVLTWTPTPVSPTPTPRATFTPSKTGTVRPTLAPSVSPTPTINPLIPTRSPYKYTASQPILMPDKYGAACGNWGGVGGQVFNIDGSPSKGVSVVGWGGPVSEQNKLVFVSGSQSRINKFYGGDGAYELYVGAPGNFDFNVVVYENSQMVSPVVKIRMVDDCMRDLALINFQRNH